MKIVSDLFAVILFFAVYSLTKNIFWATGTAVVVGIVQAAVVWFRHKKLDLMQKISLILVVVLGGATVVFRNSEFIMWKPTLLFWAGAAVLGTQHLRGKNPLKAVMGKELSLPDEVWRKLTFAWIGFLCLLGLINLAVAKTAGEAVWVNYKMFGSTTLMFVFMLLQFFYLNRYLPKENSDE